MRIIDRVKYEAYNNNNNNAFVAESFPKKFNIFISSLTIVVRRTPGLCTWDYESDSCINIKTQSFFK